jgi:DNA-binding LacI/PurR family transcriptional regulator
VDNVVGVNGRFRFDQVCFDDAQSEFEATRYVIEQGHRGVAFVGDTSYDWMDRRYQGTARRCNPAS